MSEKHYITTYTEVKNREKEDIRLLNSRLAHYVHKVRQLGDNGQNSAVFLATLSSVEEEVINLKALYNTELDALRNKLNDANKARNDNSAELERFQRAARDVGDRFQVEADKNGRLISDIGLLQTRVTHLEHELACARDATTLPKRQLEEVKAELENARMHMSELSHELQHEKSKCQQLQDKVNTLQQELDFNNHMYAEQLKQSNTRVEESKVLIGQLDARVQESESGNASLPDLLEQMRKMTEKEIRTYKEELNASTNKIITDLRHQAKDHLNTADHLRQDIAKLQADCSDWEIKAKTAEGKAREMQAQKNALAEQLKHEKAQSLEQVRSLERKLRDLQQTMMDKMTELNNSRDAQVSLRAEIDAMRLILEEEENRLGSIRNQTSHTYICAKPVSYDVTRSSSRVETTMSRDCKSNWQQHGDQGRSNAMVASTSTAMPQCGVSFKTSGVPYPKSSETECRDSFNIETNAQGLAGHHAYAYKVEGRTGGISWKDQPSHSVIYKQTRSRSCHGGFPKIDTGCSRMYTTRSYDVKGDGSFANTRAGNIRYGRAHYNI